MLKNSFCICILTLSLGGCQGIFEPVEMASNDENERAQSVATEVPKEQPLPEFPQIDTDSGQPVPSNNQEDEVTSFGIEIDASVYAKFSPVSEDQSFEAWLESDVGLRQISAVGTYDRDSKLLKTESPIILNFKHFSSEKQMTITTHGNDIVVIGKQFENLFIDTSSAERASGKVYLFLAGSTSPSVNTHGHTGRQGKDAVCPTQPQSCVDVDQQSQLQSPPIPKIEWQEVRAEKTFLWNQDEWTEKLKSKVLAASNFMHRDFLRMSLCGTGEFIRLNEGKPTIEGSFTLRQTLRIPKYTGEHEDRHSISAQLISAEPGENGMNSGDITILQFSSDGGKWVERIAGGTAGQGGRNLKRARRARREAMSLKSSVVSEEVFLAQTLVRRQIHATCLAEIGMRPTTALRNDVAIVPEKIEQTELGIELEQHTVHIPETPEGAELPSTTPTHANPGRIGADGIRRHYRVAQYKSWQAGIPAALKDSTHWSNSSPTGSSSWESNPALP